MTADNVNRILSQLTLEEKVSLCGAADWWRTHAIKRDDTLILPHIKTTDGPNGARGESFVSGVKAACFPSASNQAASFNTDIAYNVGKGVANEAQTKSSDVLLAPTVCLVRSPLGGRNHETYGEDPLVLGMMGAAYVNGCQSTGIAATPKHYVANEVETRRRFVSVEVDERALREIYLKPFQLILKNSKPWAWMTSYNRVNGTYASEEPRLIQSILRDEWGFDGLVMSDWVGTYSTVEAMNAGLDLEIPAPIYFRGELLTKAIKDGKVTEETLDKRVYKIIELVLKTRRLSDPDDKTEYYEDNKERDDFIAEAATEGIVLLKNENVLPLKVGTKVAVIGQHADIPPIMGGGSAVVPVDHVVTPIEGLQAAGVDFKFEPGVPVYGAVPLPSSKLISQTGSSEDEKNPLPVRIEWFHGSEVGTNPAKDEQVASPTCMIKEKWPTWLSQDYCTRMTFDITPTTSGPHIFSVVTTGTSILYVNGKKIYHREQEPVLQREAFYFFRTKLEKLVSHDMLAGKTYTVTLESWATPQHIIKGSVGGEVVQGHAVGFMEYVDVQQRIRDAATTASRSDVAIVFTGTTLEFESEGYDRTTMDLQPKEYELVDAVLAANPNTIVVNTSGSPVTLTPFADKVAGLVQVFFPGQESGTAIARILTGERNPSGRLPVSWPIRIEDNPAHGNWPGENDVVRYEESIYVGYRHYEKKKVEPLYSFGFGLSYTTFALSNLTMSGSVTKEKSLEVYVGVKNTGTCKGKVVVQFYVARVDESKYDRPVKELKAFEKPDLEAGAETQVRVSLDKYAVSIYNADSWFAEGGRYEVLVGFAADNIVASAEFDVPEHFSWTGL
ncbi:glycoside hydrolase [Corynespora cassiicola Philippines]|uniref:beta-glucosidase n=1 Tax=Corynespora cassiicola Philippines TaxID=1448308 RepID=A0A2T2NQH1_CORCC|nr:glycoside hydrolase [Corynespora cassiicola Philippines]